jgi:hypothetical protein
MNQRQVPIKLGETYRNVFEGPRVPHEQEMESIHFPPPFPLIPTVPLLADSESPLIIPRDNSLIHVAILLDLIVVKSRIMTLDNEAWREGHINRGAGRHDCTGYRARGRPLDLDSGNHLASLASRPGPACVSLVEDALEERIIQNSIFNTTCGNSQPLVKREVWRRSDSICLTADEGTNQGV